MTMAAIHILAAALAGSLFNLRLRSLALLAAVNALAAIGFGLLWLGAH
jgi:hypothetical protein